MINVQGLTRQKVYELENLMTTEENEVNMICLVETQQKFKKVDFSEATTCLEKMRTKEDKKGGGFTVVWSTKSGLHAEEVPCNNPDLLKIKIQYKTMLVTMLLVYVDCKENERINYMYKTLNDELLEVKDKENLIVLGDFNGHLGFIGMQEQNWKGRMLLDFIERWNLVLLNGDEACTGEITRIQGDQRSAIDFKIVNQALYKFFQSMSIDENKEKFDLSDHCLMESTFEIEGEYNHNGQRGRRIENEYYKTNSAELKGKFLRELENDKLHMSERNSINVADFEELLRKNADNVLKCKTTKKVLYEDKQQQKIEPIWMNANIKNEIKLRKKYNREKRNAICPQVQSHLQGLYIQQKQSAATYKS